MTAQLPSRERLEALASGNAFTCVQDDEATAMARALLAAHEQEPVAWTSQRSLDVNDKITAFTSEESAVDYGKSKAWVNIVPLYAHPALVPAVPDEMTPKQASRAYCGEVRGYRDGWNACRAAMLNHPEQHLDMVGHSGDVNKKVAPPIQSGNSAQPVTVPDGYVLMPMKLTAENGAKYALSGEFHVLHRVTCHECGGEGCSDCDDDGWLEEKIMIGWDDIKDIYRAAVEACSIKSTGEGV